MLYNVTLVSAIQQRESAIGDTCVPTLPPLPHPPLQAVTGQQAELAGHTVNPDCFTCGDACVSPLRSPFVPPLLPTSVLYVCVSILPCK